MALFKSGKIKSLLSECEDLIKEKNYENARAKALEILSLEPNCPQAYYYLGICEKKESNFDKSLQYFDKSLSLDNSLKQKILWQQLDIYKSQNDFVRALTCAEELLKINNSDDEALREKGILSYKLGKLSEAEKILETCLAINSSDEKTVLAYSDLKFQQKEYKKAINELSKIIEIRPTLEGAYFMRGKCKLEIGELENAISDFKKAIDINPANYENFLYLSKSFLKKNELDKAYESIQKSLSLNPKNKESYWTCLEILKKHNNIEEIERLFVLMKSNISNDCEVYSNYANFLIESKQYQKAKNEIKIALEIAPDKNTILALAGIIKYNLNEFAEALVYFDKVLQNDSTNYESLKYKALAFYKMKEYKNSIDLLNKCVELNPNDYELYFYRAKCKEELYDIQGALTDYTLALQNQDYTEAYAARGDLRMKKEDYQAAILDYTKAVKLSNKNPEYLYKRAVAYHKQNQLSEAFDDVNLAIRFNDKLTEAYILRGMINIALIKYKDALNDFLTACSLDPSLKEPLAKLITACKSKL